MADDQTPAQEAQPNEQTNEAPPSEGPSDSWLDALPDEQRDYIKSLRKENAQRRTENRDIRKQLDTIQKVQEQQETAQLAEQNKWQELYEKEKTAREQMAADLQAQQLNMLKLTIAAQFKLPPELATRLQGDDEDALRADAETLAKLIPGEPPAANQDTPARSQTTSAVPDGQPTTETRDQKLERLNPRINKDTPFSNVNVIMPNDG